MQVVTKTAKLSSIQIVTVQLSHYLAGANFLTIRMSVKGVKRNVELRKLLRKKGRETRHSESKLRHGSQHMECGAQRRNGLSHIFMKVVNLVFFGYIETLYLMTVDVVKHSKQYMPICHLHIYSRS